MERCCHLLLKPSLLLWGECHSGAQSHPAPGLWWCAQAQCGVLAGAGRVPWEMLCGDLGCLQPARNGGEVAGLDPACAASSRGF